MEPEGWTIAVAALTHDSASEGGLSHDAAGCAGLEARRWSALLHGWLPALRALALTLSALRQRDDTENAEAATVATAVGAGPRAPLDLLSLAALCQAHAALELVVRWGVAPRLDPAGAARLLPAPAALSSPVANLLVKGQLAGPAPAPRALALALAPACEPSPAAGAGVDGATRRPAPPEAKAGACALQAGPPTVVPTGAGDGAAAGPPAAWSREAPRLRRHRLLLCAVVLERCLRAPQLRPLLLGRYLPALLAALLELGGPGLAGQDPLSRAGEGPEGRWAAAAWGALLAGADAPACSEDNLGPWLRREDEGGTEIAAAADGQADGTQPLEAAGGPFGGHGGWARGGPVAATVGPGAAVEALRAVAGEGSRRGPRGPRAVPVPALREGDHHLAGHQQPWKHCLGARDAGTV